MKKKINMALALATTLALSTNALANDATSSATSQVEKTNDVITNLPTNIPVPVVTEPVRELLEGETTYTILPGDTLYNIAWKYSVSFENLVNANNISNANVIYAGQTLIIPMQEATSINVNPLANKKYTVVLNDTLQKIANVHNTTVERLVAVNNFANPNFILEGQVIEIPVTVETLTPTVDPIVEIPKVEETPATQLVETTEVTTTSNLKDGFYVGINEDYSTDEALDNWDYFVTIEVKDGLIIDVDWDAKSEMNSTLTKEEVSRNGEYGMLNSSKLGIPWYKQAETVENFFLEHQTTDVFEYSTEDERKLVAVDGVDTTSSVSIKVDQFVKYTDAAVAKANGELPVTENVDAISTASITTNASDIVSALSSDGNWIVAALGDVVVDEPIVVDGTFYKKNNEENGVYRKLTPSNHVYDTEGNRDKTKEEFYVLTAKQGIIVNSPNFNLVNGTIVGDITVTGTGFTTNNMTIFGNINFANQEARDTANLQNTNIIGEVTPLPSVAYNDGTYTGVTEITEDSKYQDFVEVIIKFNQIAYVNYNPMQIVDGVVTEIGKKELDASGEYGMSSDVGTWTEQANALENYALNGNDLTNVDTVSGATIGNSGFFTALQNALEQAK